MRAKSDFQPRALRNIVGALITCLLAALAVVGVPHAADAQQGPMCFVEPNANGGVSITYTNLQGSGSDIIESDGTVTWDPMDDFRPGLISHIDPTPSASYTVQWWGLGGADNGLTATCDNPNPPEDGPLCFVEPAGNGAVAVTYTNLQGLGSDIIESDGTVTWDSMDDFRPALISHIDPTPSASYTVQWWGLQNGNGVTATCDNPNPPQGGPMCFVEPGVNGAVTVSYWNLQGSGSDIIEANGTVTWHEMYDFREGILSFSDSTPSASYSVQYWGLGDARNGLTISCANEIGL